MSSRWSVCELFLNTDAFLLLSPGTLGLCVVWLLCLFFLLWFTWPHWSGGVSCAGRRPSSTPSSFCWEWPIYWDSSSCDGPASVSGWFSQSWCLETNQLITFYCCKMFLYECFFYELLTSYAFCKKSRGFYSFILNFCIHLQHDQRSLFLWFYTSFICWQRNTQIVRTQIWNRFNPLALTHTFMFIMLQ